MLKLVIFNIIRSYINQIILNPLWLKKYNPNYFLESQIRKNKGD